MAQWKRILSMIFAVALTVQMLPSAAFAEQEEAEPTPRGFDGLSIVVHLVYYGISFSKNGYISCCLPFLNCPVAIMDSSYP